MKTIIATSLWTIICSVGAYQLGFSRGDAQRGTIACTGYRVADLSHIRVSGNPLISTDSQMLANSIAKAICWDEGL